MTKLATTLKKSLIERFGVKVPEYLDIEYVDYPCSDDEIVKACEGASYLLTSPIHIISRNLIERLDSVKMIHSLGVGFDKIDLEAAREKGIYVCNNSGVNSQSVAELAVGMMSNSLRRIVQTDAKIKAGGYEEQFMEYRKLGQRELGTATVGLVGMGSIGKVIARLLNAYGSKLYYCDVVEVEKDFANKYDLEKITYDEICEKCDVICFQVPVLDATRGMLNSEAIAKMKQDAVVVNVSRGEIVNNEDLKDALEGEKIFAALDVLAPEPPSKDHPLLNLNEVGNSRLSITPHIGGTTNEAFIRMQIWVYENIARLENGERPIHIVNGL